ncbi:hypothetical protein, partial [Bathymodiolus thermophilus thioautotrophic gill symbiont]
PHCDFLKLKINILHTQTRHLRNPQTPTYNNSTTSPTMPPIKMSTCATYFLLNTTEILGSLRERATLTPAKGCFKPWYIKNTKAF